MSPSQYRQTPVTQISPERWDNYRKRYGSRAFEVKRMSPFFIHDNRVKNHDKSIELLNLS